jgi:hypothetical protein
MQTQIRETSVFDLCLVIRIGKNLFKLKPASEPDSFLMTVIKGPVDIAGVSDVMEFDRVPDFWRLFDDIGFGFSLSELKEEGIVKKFIFVRPEMEWVWVEGTHQSFASVNVMIARFKVN